MTDGECRVCGTSIETKPWDRYTANEQEVCTDCWFGELDGAERKGIAIRANAKRERRLTDD